MRQPFRPIALIAAALLVLVPPAPSKAATQGLAIVDAAWLRAIKANDADAVAACYASDAVVWLPYAAEVIGTANPPALFASLLTGNVVLAATLSNPHYWTKDTLSAGWGQFSLTLQPKAGGSPRTVTGRFTAIAEKRAGGWVLVAHHASLDAAASPAPEK